MEEIVIYTDGSHFKHLPGGFIGYGAYSEHLGSTYRMSGRCDADCLKTYEIPANTKDRWVLETAPKGNLLSLR
jgi:hypothetical protein